jgi:hypothetical protein
MDAAPNSKFESTTVNVRPNLMFFWLQSTLTVDDRGITGRVPNTVFGVIPVGSKEIMFPLKQISGISISSKFHIFRAFFGFIFTFSGAVGLFDSPADRGLAIGMTFVGLLLAFNAYIVSLNILNTGHGVEQVRATWLDKQILEHYSNKVRSLIATL